METREIHGEQFEVNKGGKINGDYIYEGKNIYIDGDLEVTGRFECARFKITGSVKVNKSYIVNKWEEIGRSQKIGWSQEIGRSQEIGGAQEIGGNATVVYGINVGLSINVKGTLRFGKRLFAGTCSWRDISKEEMTITCGKLEGDGEIIHGILNEIEIKSYKKEMTPKEVCEELGREVEITK